MKTLEIALIASLMAIAACGGQTLPETQSNGSDEAIMHAQAVGTWVYNSDDHDAKAKFFSYGEHVKLCKLNNAYVYVKIKAYNSAGSVVEERRGEYDGAIDSCRDFNYAFGEGLDVYIKVCEQKRLGPDDCSAWDYQGKS